VDTLPDIGGRLTQDGHTRDCPEIPGGGLHVAHPETDVMASGVAIAGHQLGQVGGMVFEELQDHTVEVEGGQFGDRLGMGVESLGHVRAPRLRLEVGPSDQGATENSDEEGHGLVEVGDGGCDVLDPHQRRQ
jgi:hypothetical protein